MKHGSLFSGIGGFDLGFERAGIETIWQVEIEDYCRRVLARHFPAAIRYDDIRTVGKHNLAPVDIISGGFPCQDISNAGKRAGIDGERSGLWSEYARIISELRPRYVVVENVAALLGRGMERVLGDLATCGYDAEWQSIRASDVGAPHLRDRIWIIAYPESNRAQGRVFDAWRGRLIGQDGNKGNLADATSNLRRASRDERSKTFDGSCPDVAHSALPKIFTRFSEVREGTKQDQSNGLRNGNGDAWRTWATEPDVGRVAHGVPARVDRLRGLGNAIVPQIAEWIGRRIVSFEQDRPTRFAPEYKEPLRRESDSSRG